MLLADIRSKTLQVAVISLLAFAFTAAQSTEESVIVFSDESNEDISEKILIKPDQYILYWDSNGTDIIFETHVKGDNIWSAFGISPTGTMEKANMVVSYLNPNGSCNFSDRFSNITGSVEKNGVPQWFLIGCESSNGTLISRFTRKLMIENKGVNHVDITESELFLIFAYRSLESQSLSQDQLLNHGRDQRGHSKMNLLDN